MNDFAGETKEVDSYLTEQRELRERLESRRASEADAREFAQSKLGGVMSESFDDGFDMESVAAARDAQFASARDASDLESKIKKNIRERLGIAETDDVIKK